MDRSGISSKFRDLLDTGLRIGQIRGIEIKLHVTLLLLLILWIIPAAFAPTPLFSVLYTTMFVGVLFGSVLLHELGHCYGAHLVGGHSKEIVLWPLGGLAVTSGAEKSAYDEFLIVLLGPAVSLVLAISATLASWILPLTVPEAWAEATAGLWFQHFLAQVRWVNWALFLFNMLVPLFPMDCARLVRSLGSMRFSPQKVTYNVCLLGLFAAGAMTCLFFVNAHSVISASSESPPETLTGMFGGVFFLLIAMFGVQNCLLEMKRLEHSHVYTDPFPQGPPYSELFSRVVDTLGISRTKAEVLEIHGKADPTPEAELSPREKLERELDEAVTKEDFKKAARIRDKLQSMTAESQRR